MVVFLWIENFGARYLIGNLNISIDVVFRFLFSDAYCNHSPDNKEYEKKKEFFLIYPV